MTRLAAAVAKNDAYWIENNIGGGIKDAAEGVKDFADLAKNADLSRFIL